MTLPPRYARSTFAAYRPVSPEQAAAADAARAFVEAVRAHVTEGGFFRRRPPLPARGLYLVGPVGTGKTHLLAACLHALCPAVPTAFVRSSTLLRTPEPPDVYAASLARRYRVVCIDEVEVDDPAGEVRLVRTLKALDAHDVVVIATSNVEPENFVGAAFGGDRFERFLAEFSATYRVVVVPGDDFRTRLARDGRAVIGPADVARATLRRYHDAAPDGALWLDWADFLVRSRETEHTALVDVLAGARRLYLAGVDPTSTDDALRLLRVLDDLYVRPNVPILYYSSASLPETWFADARGGIEGAIADKFARTVSRLHALTHVEHVGDDGSAGVSPPRAAAA